MTTTPNLMTSTPPRASDRCPDMMPCSAPLGMLMLGLPNLPGRPGPILTPAPCENRRLSATMPQ